MYKEGFRSLEQKLPLDKQEEQVSDLAWNNRSVTAKCGRIDEDKTQIESEIALHLVNELGLIFVKMYLLNHFSNHICQIGNLLNISFELPEKAMM
jgi:hypothetical protein